MKKGKSKNNGLLPSSLKIISSCLKTVSTNASTVASTVRSAGASVAATISAASFEDQKDQVTWAGFDTLEYGPSVLKRVLLLGYSNGFQIIDVEDASNFNELVSKRDGPVSFLQMQPFPAKSVGHEGFRRSHPLLLVVAGEGSNGSSVNQSQLGGFGRDGIKDSMSGNSVSSPSTVRFYSLKSHCYVHVLRFRSSVCMVRCSSRIVVVGLATQIYCFDAVTLENKLSVLTYPVPQLLGQGTIGVNVGYGPMAVGPRWLAYASNIPLLSNTGRLSPQNFSPSPGVSPSTSPSSGHLMARYAMESGKHLAAGILNLGDVGYKTFSKYCQELLPDGSNSPVLSNSGWKVGRLAGAEMDTAGMVVVKDFVSGAVISQFKAHTSPLSALCFDPSGTLLVTASVYGNNINIFRIMPSRTCSGSCSQTFDWSSSHVHLYKLHRGITSAMIQDICFSYYSQWIGVVSSKGTCHVFVLSPYGGDTGFKIIDNQSEEPSLLPVISLPWWSASSLTINQQSFPTPQPISLSVVSRIKYSSFGWLNSVNNASAQTTAKVFVPSGAVAAIFHNSLLHSSQHKSRGNTLEHLLVYTPSGHVVQHELLPSIGAEWSQSGFSTQPIPCRHMQEDELRLKVEPIQWWDVCRRSDCPEREDCKFGTTIEKQDMGEMIQNKALSQESYESDFLDLSDGSAMQTMVRCYSGKLQERSHWCLSNAEVQISSGRLPIWQNSKIQFYTMVSPSLNSSTSGEFEIENIPSHEVEISRKELLPAFDHFHSVKSAGRSLVVGRFPNSMSSEPLQVEEKITEEIVVICHSNPASLSSTESSDGGSSRRMENLLDLDQLSCDKLSYIPAFQSLNEMHLERRGRNDIDSSIITTQIPFSTTSTQSEHFSENGRVSTGILSSNTSKTSNLLISGCDQFSSGANIIASGGDLDGCDPKKHEEEADNDVGLGGIFLFSEEG